MLPKKIAFVDIETTGCRTSYDRIIEIGILRVEDGSVTATYNTLINPQTYIPSDITKITGITSNDVERAPTFRQCKDDILELLSDCVFVAHNVRFDYGFLKSEFNREEVSFSSKHFCTVRLSRMLYPSHRHHNLDAIMARFTIPCPNRHRAFDDASVLFEFYKKAQNDFSEEVFLNAVNLAQRKPSLPIKLKQEDLDTLPEQPGVYIFYGKSEYPNTKSQINSNVQNTKLQTRKIGSLENLNFENCLEIRNSDLDIKKVVPLYIGKSVNIRDRVLSHFSSDIRMGNEMKLSQQVENIETITTAGELGALFLESQLIKEKLPIHNKMLRLKRELVAIKQMRDPHGYDTASIETITKINYSEHENFLGFFRSKKQAKEFLTMIADEFGLCKKLLSLEKSLRSRSGQAGECFGYRLEKCKGACKAAEKPLFYNLRFITAFSKLKIKPWPFPSPILIEERNDIARITESFLIDKWCYLGSVRTDDRNARKETLVSDVQFDLDMYKILRRFLQKAENLKKVKLVRSRSFTDISPDTPWSETEQYPIMKEQSLLFQ